MISLLIEKIRFATLLITLLTLSTGCHLNVESAPSGPGQPKVNVNSNVSNIRIGNVKRTNINMFDKNHKGPIIVDNGSSPSAIPNFNMNTTPIDIQSILGKGLSNIVSIGNKSGKPGGPIGLTATLTSESGLGGPASASAQAHVSAQLSEKAPVPTGATRPAWAREINEDPEIVATASVEGPKAKKAKSATAEQLEMKNRLLELAAKATDIPGGDGPILKYNPELGKFETVEVDPNTKIYKEMLRDAIEALSAKKLSPKKLRKILGDLEAAQPDQLEPAASEATPPAVPEPSTPAATGESMVAEPLKYIIKNAHKARNLFDIYNTPIKAVEEKPAPAEEPSAIEEPAPAAEEPSAPPAPEPEEAKEARQKMESWLGSKWSQGRSALLPQAPPAEAPPAPEPEPAPIDEDRQKLIDEVRSQLDDRINRISDLLYFRTEFLNLLLTVDDAKELTPIESVFKRMILCNSDEQFCLQPDLSPAKEVDENVADEQLQEAVEKAEEEAAEKAAEEAKEGEDDDDELHLNPYWQGTSFVGYTPTYIRHHQLSTDGAVAAAAAARAADAQVAANAHAEAAAAAAAAHDAAMAASEEAAKRHADHLASLMRPLDYHPLDTFKQPPPMRVMPPMAPMAPMPPAFHSPPAWAYGTQAMAGATSS